jgi:hypothetical protein
MERYGFHLAVGFGAMFLGSFVVGVRSSAAISREREQQTWEALLLAPVRTIQVVYEKFWAILHAAAPYVLAYAATALAVGVVQIVRQVILPGKAAGGADAVPLLIGELLFALFWLVGMVALMAWVTSSGLWCSARTASSWRSLLGTLGFGYYVGLFLCVLPPAVLGFALVLAFEASSSWGTQGGSVFLTVSLISVVVFALLSLGCFWLMYVMTRSNLRGAEEAILEAERTWRIPEGMIRGPFARRPPYSRPPR